MPGYGTAHELMYERDRIIQSLLRRLERVSARHATGWPQDHRRILREVRAINIDFRSIVRLTADIEDHLERERSFDSWFRTLTVAERREREEFAYFVAFHRPKRRD
ncbi:Nn.00g010970.m01.CDS01 [Neocucurbitaria sp. VM-36]